MRIHGIVSSGLGRAHIFMSQELYQNQFKTIIGKGAGLAEGEGSDIELHRVKGFDRDGVSFGGATAFLATIESKESIHDCAVLIPDLTRHEDVVEVIADVFLRESCSLVDGDMVSIVLE